MASQPEWVYVGAEGAPALDHPEAWRIDPDNPLRFRASGVRDRRGCCEYVEIDGAAVDVPSDAERTLAEARKAGAVPPASSLPDWVGTEPVVEPVTFGQGSFGHRCRLCGANDYLGPLTHRQGCPAA
jgi:hypothetical protein